MMEDLDVVEVASTVEEESEVVCRLRLCLSQNAMTMDRLDAVCRQASNSSMTVEFDVLSAVEEELEVLCRRRCCVQNATMMDESFICHEGGREGGREGVMTMSSAEDEYELDCVMQTDGSCYS